MKFFKRYAACYGCDCSHVGKSTKEMLLSGKKEIPRGKKKLLARNQRNYMHVNEWFIALSSE